jgi:glycosyltransferase 2 family protein
MNKKLLTIFKYVLLLGVAAALLFFAFRGMDIKKIVQQILGADMFWVTASGIISILAFVIRAHRWNLLIEPMGYSPTLKNTTASLMVGYFANLALPRMGEVSRCGALSKAESVPFNKLLGTVIIERIIDVISLLICMLITAVLEYKRLGNFFDENIVTPLLNKFSFLASSPLLLGSLFIIFLLLILFLIYFSKKNKAKNVESKISRLLKGFLDGLRSVANLKRPGLFIFESVLIWLLYFAGVYVALYAFNFTTGLGASAALFLLVAGGIGMSAPVQVGIGAYHLLVSQGLMLYGMSEENGLVFAGMLHSLQLVLVIIMGSLSLFILLTSRKKHQTDTEKKASF